LGIRVVEVNYKPGQSSSMHSHPDAALYIIDGGKGEFTGKDGTKDTIEFKKGMSMITPADSHSVKNIGQDHSKGNTGGSKSQIATAFEQAGKLKPVR
jgi:quercetin dioxygenase-like cupin family protein